MGETCDGMGRMAEVQGALLLGKRGGSIGGGDGVARCAARIGQSRV